MYSISVDTGGTFTDVVVADKDGKLTIGKALTTRSRVFTGMRNAIGAAADTLGIAAADLLAKTDTLIYGTTRATNAIVTRNVAKTAFLTTRGFPDILFLREAGKYNAHDFSKDYPDPYIPRRHTFEVTERISSEGAILLPLDELQLRSTLERLREQKFEAVAVCLLWSIANPVHEDKVGTLIREILPDVPFTLSHELIPIVREYRRASATAIDASLKPLMQEHLLGLEADLRAEGYTGDIMVSTASGGCSTINALVEKPIYTIGSGPAMAPLASLAVGQLERAGNNIIVCDTGGTTFDIGLVREGDLTYTRETWVGEQWTGELLGISSVDMRSVGAGGGSIAWVDSGGLMRVGPQSAGSEPGPACYGRGGTLPTVSDAAVVLGYFDPGFFLGGRMTLNVEAARRAVATVADRVGVPVEVAAYQIINLASEQMIKAINDITVKQGINPRESTIVAGGGAAGINIMLIAREMGCSRAVLPRVASALSASGMQFADLVAEEAASFPVVSDRFDFARVNAVLEKLTSQLEPYRSAVEDKATDVSIQYIAEARYHTQIWDIDVPLPSARFDSQADLDTFVRAFHDAHERILAVRDEDSPVEVINWRARLVASRAKPDLAGSVSFVSAAEAPSHRDCFFGEETAVRTAIFKPAAIRPGLRIDGPAIIEEVTTTLVVYPGTHVTVSEYGNFLLSF
ncbi:hydantoinase/oxoprolinase family protein [Aminobacter aminovorans]|uniref:5-oxoprolinase n=1 Tax=Aminobacter aminovorans TaxID=83263 RepID=A0AAC8YVX8_AMIAI|nr:hydantoinase/oxoprolinase family protein [Aminobacter aminovorans]AMS45462.1 5-oxoprolinase [Aminobacter aminovorans]MBB3708669.1 N-methylhydantoinase A [Aminobacter aminovorans]